MRNGFMYRPKDRAGKLLWLMKMHQKNGPGMIDYLIDIVYEGYEKRAKSVVIPLIEINAPSMGLYESQLPCGMISFLTLHFVIFLTLFFLRPFLCGLISPVIRGI